MKLFQQTMHRPCWEQNLKRLEILIDFVTKIPSYSNSVSITSLNGEMAR